MTNERRWSPIEEKVMHYATSKHEGQTRIGGESYFNHPKRVAEYLYDRGYRGKYVFTAFCHDLLEDTDATKEGIFSTCGRFTRDAVKLLTKEEGMDIALYLKRIEKNEVAYIVKVADRIDNLLDAKNANLPFQKRYLEETKNYYLEFAADSPFYEDLLDAYEALKESYEYETSKLIEVFVENAYKAINGAPEFNVLDSFFYGNEPGAAFPIACTIGEEDIDYVLQQKNKPLTITLSGVPAGEMDIYKDAKEYHRAHKEEPKFALPSFCSSWQTMRIEDKEIPDPSACFTGTVKQIYEPFEIEEDNTAYYAVDVETLGIIVTLLLRDSKTPLPRVGNVISGVFKLNGYVDLENQ
jgi:GTP pyrophosphokinase